MYDKSFGFQCRKRFNFVIGFTEELLVIDNRAYLCLIKSHSSFLHYLHILKTFRCDFEIAYILFVSHCQTVTMVTAGRGHSFSVSGC